MFITLMLSRNPVKIFSSEDILVIQARFTPAKSMSSVVGHHPIEVPGNVLQEDLLHDFLKDLSEGD